MQIKPNFDPLFTCPSSGVLLTQPQILNCSHRIHLTLATKIQEEAQFSKLPPVCPHCNSLITHISKDRILQRQVWDFLHQNLQPCTMDKIILQFERFFPFEKKAMGYPLTKNQFFYDKESFEKYYPGFHFILKTCQPNNNEITSLQLMKNHNKTFSVNIYLKMEKFLPLANFLKESYCQLKDISLKDYRDGTCRMSFLFAKNLQNLDGVLYLLHILLKNNEFDRQATKHLMQFLNLALEEMKMPQKLGAKL